VRIFSSASDAPRARRPTDIVLLIISVLGIVVLSVPAPGPTKLDTAIAQLVKELPGLIGWFWEISYDLLIGWAVILLVLAMFGRGRKHLLLDELLAAAFALGFALIAGNVAGTDWSASFRAASVSHPPPIYLAVRLAIATAVVVTASPHMARPLRHVGRWVIALGAVAGIALGVTLPIGMVAGFIIGIGSAAIVHLLLGSPGGRLTLEQVAAALEELGVAATDLRYAPLEPRGVALVTASADDRALVVKIYGRDAWDGQFLTSAWSALWHRGETPHVGGGRLQQVEHEAFVTLFAERAGVPVFPIVAAGVATEGDALLVSEATGHPFHTLDSDEAGDGLLRQLWDVAASLHDVGVAHGHLDGYSIVIRPDGTPALADFGDATVAAPDSALLTDQAQLLVTTALCVGPERAVAAAETSLGPDGVTDVLPFLQPAVLDRVTRQAVRDEDWDLDDLRSVAASRAGSELPPLEKVRRVTWGSVVMVILLGIVVYALIGALADVGLRKLIDELKGADATWLMAALLISPVIQMAQAVSTMGASIQAVRYGPVLMLQYAIQFIALAVPSSAARVALEVRFFERNGVGPGGAVSIGVIDSVCGFIVQIILILTITLSGLASLSFSSSASSSSSSSSSGSSHGFLILLVMVLALAAIAALAIPRYRAMIREALPQLRTTLREQAAAGAAALRVLRSPTKVIMIFLGNLMGQLLQAVVLGLALKAFGYEASFAGLILVNTAVSLFAGFMPVPGGMGVSEAGYTAGLVALGIPDTAAMSTAIAFRLVTFYLPPIWGSIAMRWLKHHAYV
jgi:uncharacterized protein (TIRG00374 family)